MPTRYRVEANILLFALVTLVGLVLPIVLMAGCDAEPDFLVGDRTDYPGWLSVMAKTLIGIAFISSFFVGLPIVLYVAGVIAAFFALKKRWIDD